MFRTLKALQVGDEVECWYDEDGGSGWDPARIREINSDDTYTICWAGGGSYDMKQETEVQRPAG